MTTPLPPAGWVPDPQHPGQQRWWDGAQWTEFTTAWAQDGTRPPTPSTVGPLRPRPTGPTGSRVRRAISARPKVAAGVGIAAAALILVGAIGIGANAAGGSSDADLAVAPAASTTAEPAARPAATPTPSASAKPSRTATSTPKPSPTPTPVTRVETAETSEAIGYGQSSYEDGNVDVGTTVVVTAGVPGTKVSRWEITTVDGVETGRVLVAETVTVSPVDEVTAIGIRQPPPPPAPEPVPDAGGCDPNYAGVCVPIASDVDCAGGSGNGPAYVAGPVQVIGSDIYDLDRDGDGIACD
ncbi:MAG: G5 domain-containing protein [Herbiconiux sp.]|nr:G5 domain-containing protein [Herbiconiux sp.]